MINVAIVEDDAQDFDRLKTMLNRYSDETHELFKVSAFQNAVDFLDNYYSRYDLIFMDVEMPGIDGLQASQKLRELDRHVCLIFVTNMVQYAYAGYGVEAFDFIGKPLQYGNFVLTLRRAINQIKMNRDIPILLKVKEGVIKISQKSILYVEVQGHQITYHTEKGLYAAYGTLKNIREALNEQLFCLCNNSYYVNLGTVIKIDKDEVTLLDGTVLSVSRSKKKEFIARMNSYMGGNSIV